MPKVLNKKRGGIPEGAVYVGRPSKWGNPFIIGRPPFDGSREAVVERYRTWLEHQSSLMAALPELRGKDLVCWCAPLQCHADVLLELANS